MCNTNKLHSLLKGTYNEKLNKRAQCEAPVHHLELQEVVNPLPGDRGFSGCLGTGTGGSVSPAEEPSLPSEVRGLCRARGMESRAGEGVPALPERRRWPGLGMPWLLGIRGRIRARSAGRR